MRTRHWTPSQIAQGFRDQGVPWTESEIRARAYYLYRELLNMQNRDRHRDRKFYRNEVPHGLADENGSYSDLATLNQHERLRREDWGDKPKSARRAPAKRKTRIDDGRSAVEAAEKYEPCGIGEPK